MAKREKYGKINHNAMQYEQHKSSSIISDINIEMDIEQKYYKLPDIPSGKPGQSWWGKKYASTTDDLLEYTEYLRIIFNSPSLCIQDFIYGFLIKD